jgi:hypothetical protein
MEISETAKRIENMRNLHLRGLSFMKDFVVAFDTGITPEQLATLHHEAAEIVSQWSVVDLEIRNAEQNMHPTDLMSLGEKI